MTAAEVAEYQKVTGLRAADAKAILAEAAAVDQLAAKEKTLADIEKKSLSDISAARMADVKAIQAESAAIDALTAREKGISATTAEGVSKLTAARMADVKALEAESVAMKTAVQNADMYNRMVAWEGNTNPNQYLAYKQRLLEYQRLLNIQLQRGFFTPQQNYAWRQQELSQQLLWNKAVQQGYTTPDQYLGYLVSLRNAMQLENLAWTQRAAALEQATRAQLDMSNAVAGTNKSVAQLAGEKSVLLTLSDEKVKQQLAAVGSAVSATVTLTDAQMRGAVVFDMGLLHTLGDMVARPRVELDATGVMTGVAQIEAALAAVRAAFTETVREVWPVSPAQMTGGTNTGASPPLTLNVAPAEASMAEFMAKLVTDVAVAKASLMGISMEALAEIEAMQRAIAARMPDFAKFQVAASGVVTYTSSIAAAQNAAPQLMLDAAPFFATMLEARTALTAIGAETADPRLMLNAAPFRLAITEAQAELKWFSDQAEKPVPLMIEPPRQLAITSGMAPAGTVADNAEFAATEAGLVRVTAAYEAEARAAENAALVQAVAAKSAAEAQLAAAQAAASSTDRYSMDAAAAAAAVDAAAAAEERAARDVEAAWNAVEASEARAAASAVTMSAAQTAAAAAESKAADDVSSSVRDAGDAFDYEAARAANAAKTASGDTDRQTAAARKLADSFLNAGLSADAASARLKGMAAAMQDATAKATYLQAAEMAAASGARDASAGADDSARSADAAGLSAAELAAKWQDAVLSSKNLGDGIHYMNAATIAAGVEQSKAADSAKAWATQVLNMGDAEGTATAAVHAANIAQQGLTLSSLAVAAAAAKAGAAAGDMGNKVTLASAVGRAGFGLLSRSMVQVGGLFGWLGTKVALFGGLFQVGIWHIILDFFLELGIQLGLAAIGVAALAAAVGIFIGVANLSADTLGRISDRLKAVYSASTATGQAIAPMTNSFDKLQTVIRPEVWQLYGDALNLVGGKMGILGKIAEDTGAYLDRLAGRVIVWVNQNTGAFETLIKAGVGMAQRFGQVFLNIGQLLAKFFQVAQETHIAEYLLDVGIALTKLLDIVTKIPAPILAVALALHAIYLWGGLAVTGIITLLDPLRSLAMAMGGVSAASSALANLPKNAGALEKLKAVFQDIGTGLNQVAHDYGGTAAAAAAAAATQETVAAEAATAATAAAAAQEAALDRLMAAQAEEAAAAQALADAQMAADGQVTAATEEAAAAQAAAQVKVDAARAESVAATRASSAASDAALTEQAAATDATAASEAAAAGSTGLFGTALASLGPLLANPYTWIVALVAVLGAFTAKVVMTRDATQDWINNMNTALAKTSVYTVISQTVGDLAATTANLTKAQKDNSVAAGELATSQGQLNDKLILETTRVSQVAQVYGTNFVGALALLNTAQVTTAQLTSTSSKVWAGALVQVNGLIAGYKAMGQGLTQLQGDVSVQLVVNADQVASMAKLNTAWDTWLTTVTGGETALDTWRQNLATVTTNAKVAGASMDGLNAQSTALNSSWQTLVTSGGSVLDQIRTQSAVLENGVQGTADLNNATKDLAATMIPLAGNSKTAQAGLLALVQEANPSITTWQQLTRWVGNTSAAAGQAGLTGILAKLEVPLSDLQKDAQNLTTSLQADLNPAMAAAIFNAHGGQAVFSNFADAVTKFGKSSPEAKAALGPLLGEIIAVDGKTTAGKSAFEAFAESLGYTKPQADKMWSSFKEGASQAAALQGKLADLATGGKNIAKDGFWQQMHDDFFRAFDSKPVQDLLKVFTTSFKLDLAELGFGAGVFGDTIVGVFKTAGDLLTGHWSAAWGQVKTTGGQIWHQLENLWQKVPGASEIDKAFKTAADAVTGFFTSPSFTKVFTHDIPAAFNSVTGFFTSPSFTKVFTHDIPALWASAWSGLVDPVEHAFDHVKSFITSSFDKWWTTHGEAVKQIWDTIWAALSIPVTHGLDAAKNAILLFYHWFNSLGVGTLFKDMGKAAQEEWGKIEQGAKATWNAIKAAAGPIFAGLWHGVESGAQAVWKVISDPAVWKDITGVAKATFGDLWVWVKNIAKDTWDIIVLAAKAMWATVVALGKIAWDTLVVIIDLVLDTVTGHWHQAWVDIKEYAIQVWNALKGFFETTWTALVTFIKQAWHNGLQTMYDDTVKNFFTDIVNWFRNSLPNAVKDFVNFWTTTVPQIWDSFVKNVVDPFVGFFTGGSANSIPGMVRSVSNTISGAVTNWWHSFYNTFVTPVTNFFKNLPATIVSAFAGIGSSILSGLGSAGKTLLGLVGIHLSGGGPAAGGGPAVNVGPGQVKAAGGAAAGTAGSGIVPAMLTPGEYVIGKPAVDALSDKVGPQFLGNLNQAHKILTGQSIPTLQQTAPVKGQSVPAGATFGPVPVSAATGHVPGTAAQKTGVTPGGGPVPGMVAPAGTSQDTVPALLAAGEFVINKDAVQAITAHLGPQYLDTVNQAHKVLAGQPLGQAQGSPAVGTHSLPGAAVSLLISPGGPAPRKFAAGGTVGTSAASVQTLANLFAQAAAAGSADFGRMWTQFGTQANTANVAVSKDLTAYLGTALKMLFSTELPKWLSADSAAIAGTWRTAGADFTKSLVTPAAAFFGTNIAKWSSTATADISKIWATGGGGLAKGLTTPAQSFFAGITKWSSTATANISGIWTSSAASLSKLVTPATAFFSSSMPKWASADTSAISTMWTSSAASLSKLVTPAAAFFNTSLPGYISSDQTKLGTLWSTGYASFDTDLGAKVTTFFNTSLPGYLATDQTKVASLWSTGYASFDTDLGAKVTAFFSTSLPGYLSTDQTKIASLWSAAYTDFDTDFGSKVAAEFNSTLITDVTSMTAKWNTAWLGTALNLLTVLSNAGKTAAPIIQTAITGAIKAAGSSSSSITSALESATSGAEGTITSDIESGIKAASGTVKVTVTAAAAGGVMGSSRMAQSGAVPGAGEHDSVPALLMPGEFVVRKPARMALESQFGAGYMNRLNQADSWLGSGSRGILASQKGMAAGGPADPVITVHDVPSAAFTAALKAAQATLAAAAAAAGAGGVNLETIAKYLMAHGASKAGAAGIASVISGESGGNPESVGSGGGGLIGWTPLPAGYVTGNASADMATQLPAVIAYAAGRPGGWPGVFASITDPVAAGNAWSAYEAPLVALSDTRPSVATALYAAGYASGGPALGTGDYVPPPVRIGDPRTAQGIPYPVIPFPATVSAGWNALVGDSWTAQNQLGTDFNALLTSVAHVTPTAPLRTALTTLTALQRQETLAWNAMASQSNLPLQQSSATYANLISAADTYRQVLNSSAQLRAKGSIRDARSAAYGQLGADLGNGSASLIPSVQAQRVMWQELWSPAGALSPAKATPGPGNLPGGPTPDFAGSSPIPVYGYGYSPFAAGGGVPGGQFVSLNSLLGQMSVAPVALPSGRIDASGPVRAVDSAVSVPKGTSVRSEAASAGSVSSNQTVTFGDIKIYNPRPELSSTSITRATQRAAWQAGRHLE